MNTYRQQGLAHFGTAVLWALATSWLVSCGDIGALDQKECPQPGALSCACTQAGACHLQDDGTQLACVAGRCELPICSAGAKQQVGCLCDGDVCDAGLLCINGRCQTDSGQTLRAPKTPQCYTPCQGSGIMREGAFVACDADGLLLGCLDDAYCDKGTCVSQKTQSTEGLIYCGDDLDCTAGSVCVDNACRRGCFADDACLAGEACTGGFCVETDDAPKDDAGSCAVDDDCPTFQSCIEERCYAECTGDTDCREGRVCHRKTCRVPCAVLQADATSSGGASNPNCPAATYCDSVDGLVGHCLPLGGERPATSQDLDGSSDAHTAATPAATRAQLGYHLSKNALNFSDRHVQDTLTLVNTSSTAQTFTIRKVHHTEVDPQSGESKHVETSPLHWLSIGADDDAAAKLQEISVVVPGKQEAAAQDQSLVGTDLSEFAGGQIDIHIQDAHNPKLRRWSGILEISHPKMPTQTVALSYTGNPEGRWVGRAVYLANFGNQGLEDWRADRDDPAKLQAVGNALIRRWGAMRQNRISMDEMDAVLTSLRTESWRWPSMQAQCPDPDSPNPNVACYPYDNNLGRSILSDFTPDNPVPTGVTEFPIALNMRAPNRQNQPGVWQGKIDSEIALQLAGDPRVDMRFATDPNRCDGVPANRACIHLLREFSSTIWVGGRYPTQSHDTECSRSPAETFAQSQTPWLVPGFLAGAQTDTRGRRYSYECRDQILPGGPTSDQRAINQSASTANPIPDGSARRREIQLIDGALIDGQRLLILFEERFDSFLGASDNEGFSAYGFMDLRLSREPIYPQDTVGNAITDRRKAPDLEGLTCDPEVLAPLLQASVGPQDAVPQGITPQNVSAMALGLVDGLLPTQPPPQPLGLHSAERVHYWCEDTGLFDAGPMDDGDPDGPQVPCPAGSRVVFFTLQGPQASDVAIAQNSCQTALCDDADDPETCGCRGRLNEWLALGAHSIRLDPIWTCTDADAVFCDANRYDLRHGKSFYGAQVQEAVYPPLDTAIKDAFRYKTKFQNRSGQSVGFAPEICVGNGTQIPYCYDPSAIEAITKRADCALHLYTEYFDHLGPAVAAGGAGGQARNAKVVLRDYLNRNFSYTELFDPNLSAPIVEDGFEKLNAELLVMLGDESFTTAFASRFDLAGLRSAGFEGELFEPNGISLAGGAGFEMHSLYQAAQYYQLALERFYRLSPSLWTSLNSLPPGQGVVGAASVASYFARLIRASAQKSRVFGEIATRYQSFNRPDLARNVIKRAYTATHLESMVLSRMILRLVELPNSSEASQILAEVERAQHTYRASLMAMQNAYQDITDEVTFFGFDPDFIPIPVLYRFDANAFTKMMARAEQKLALAKEKEVRALQDKRAFDSSSALFQAELANLGRNYENQLADICGRFSVQSGDGNNGIYPAIAKYAYLDPRAALFGDPCGLMGSGAIHEAVAELETFDLELSALRLSQNHLLAEIDDADARAQAQCDRIGSFKDFRLQSEDKVIAIRDTINSLNLIIGAADRAIAHARTLTEFAKCSVGLSTDCPTGAVAALTYGTTAAVLQVGIVSASAAIVAKESELAGIQREIVARELDDQCQSLTIDADFTVKNLRRRLVELELDALKWQYRLKLQASRIQKLRNTAIALVDQQSEATQLAINVEAARNDPNMRIYRNDAVLAADRTFYTALREAYKATKIYEYYTSQTYPELANLLLVRMVAHGDFTLEAYLAELNEAFEEFEEIFAAPDTRLMIVSLRDDIFAIPTLDDQSVATTSLDRRAMFQNQLLDPGLLDDDGYIRIPFSTQLDAVSPLTRSHKIEYIEAEIVGNATGDKLGRVYLRQRGTGVMATLEGTRTFYNLPERTAVLNTFFNLTRTYDPEVYRNERLRHRPLINTGWDLVINQRDEAVNADIDLSQLSDVKLYFYYTDFTAL